MLCAILLSAYLCVHLKRDVFNKFWFVNYCLLTSLKNCKNLFNRSIRRIVAETSIHLDELLVTWKFVLNLASS